jgi:hypothetical protein
VFDDMTHSSQTSAKYLMSKWHDDRAKALANPSHYTAAELVWLELTGAQENTVHNEDIFKVRVQPVDPETETDRKLDIRELR